MRRRMMLKKMNDDGLYLIRVFENGVEDVSKRKRLPWGNITNLTADAKLSNLVFSHWALDSAGKILASTYSALSTIVRENKVFHAIYTTAEGKIPVASAIYNNFTCAAASTDGKNYVVHEVIRHVANNHTIAEQGILYGTKKATFDGKTEDELNELLRFTDNSGSSLKTDVKKYSGNSTNKIGSSTLKISLGTAEANKGYNVHARGYAIYKDADNNVKVVYSPVATNTYNDLVAKGKYFDLDKFN